MWEIQKKCDAWSNFVVAYDVDRAYTQTYEGMEIRFMSLGDLIADIVGKTV
jgi:hypothetical protein